MTVDDTGKPESTVTGTRLETEAPSLFPELVRAFPLPLAKRLLRSSPPSTEHSLERLVHRARERTRFGAATSQSDVQLDRVPAFDWQALLDLEAWRSAHGGLGLRESFLCACARVAQDTVRISDEVPGDSEEHLEGARLCWPLKSGSEFLSFGCPVLDEALRIRLGAITEIHGEAGSGKTQLLMQLSARNPHTTLYLYSESGRFPSERLVDMATTNEPQTSADNVLDRILVERRRSVLGSPAAVLRFLRGPFQKLLEQRPQLNLLILDSIAAVVRHAYDYQQRGALAKRARWMFRFVNTLRQLMRDYYPFAVVISNQVAQRADGQLVPALGFTWTQCLNTRIRLNRVAKTSDSMLSDAGKNSGSALRSANVCYSDSGPEPGTRVSFQIDHTGARGIQVFPHRQENVH